MVRFKSTFLFAIALLLLFIVACNPFTPGLDPKPIDRNKALGDRRTLDGFFEWFRNAYQLRDTSLYGMIIDRDFKFNYFDFENNSQVFWDRDAEMLTTLRLFSNTEQISLQWNNYVYIDTSAADTVASVERMFNLNIVEQQTRVIRGVGSAKLLLKRNNRTDNWRMVEWLDKSDF